MPRRTGVSITEIAEAAGVSIATVSRILNKKDGEIRISEGTRQRVLKVADQLGYQPNLFAAALRSNRTGIIGALNPNFSGTFMSLLTMHLIRAARARDLELLVGAPALGPTEIEGQANRLQNTLFEGLLLLSDMLGYQRIMRDLQMLKKPYVAVAAGTHLEPPLVDGDEEKALTLALDYLRELGHRHIAFLGSPAWFSSARRLELFTTYMQAHDLPLRLNDLALMAELDYTPLEADFKERAQITPMQYTQRLLQQPDPPTAIFCANDGFALAAIKGAIKLGQRVPEDVSIMGYGDEITANLFHPELTTIRVPLDVMAEQAIDLLLRLIADPDDDTARKSRILVAPQLVIRESCGPAPGGAV